VPISSPSGIWSSSSGKTPRRFARTGGAHRLDVTITAGGELPGFDPQVQLQFAVDPIDPLVVPWVPFDVTQMQETQAKTPGLAGIGQPDQQIGDLLVLGLQLWAIAIAGLAHPKGTAG